jgi:hypothetical protein
MKNLKFDNALMLRTPAISYKSYSLSKRDQLMTDPFFRGALFLANPILYHLLAAKSFNWESFTEKEKLSISKYYNRMSFRPTPFGAFAGFSTVEWGNGAQIKLAASREGGLHLRFDHEAILKFLQV